MIPFQMTTSALSSDLDYVTILRGNLSAEPRFLISGNIVSVFRYHDQWIIVAVIDFLFVSQRSQCIQVIFIIKDSWRKKELR